MHGNTELCYAGIQFCLHRISIDIDHANVAYFKWDIHQSEVQENTWYDMSIPFVIIACHWNNLSLKYSEQSSASNNAVITLESPIHSLCNWHWIAMELTGLP